MNSKEEKSSIDEEIINTEKAENIINELDQNIQKADLINQDEEYSFGWNIYAEKMNGRFAMLGLAAILIIEFISNNSFLNWAGILN